MQVKLIGLTKPLIEDVQSAEELIVYCARVSNPSNQTSMESASKLIRYLIRNKHWSPFEMADMSVEIKTSRAIAAQILRHRSFSFQEFSQRYSEATTIEPVELRAQAQTNRQSSTEVIDDAETRALLENALMSAENTYRTLIEKGVARETARMALPLATQTTLYMKGSLRSWFSFLNVRLHNHAQKEIRLIAEAIRDIVIKEFPAVSEAFDNFRNAYEDYLM